MARRTSGAKAPFLFGRFTARLKSCPSDSGLDGVCHQLGTKNRGGLVGEQLLAVEVTREPEPCTRLWIRLNHFCR